MMKSNKKLIALFVALFYTTIINCAKDEKIINKMKDLPIAQEKMENINMKNLPIAQEKMENINMKNLPIAQEKMQNINMKNLPIAQEKVENINMKDLPIAQEKMENINMKNLPIAQEKMQNVNMKNLPIAQEKMENINMKNLPIAEEKMEINMENLTISKEKVEDINVKNLISNLTPFTPTDGSQDFQTIKFGKNVVSVYDTNEIKHDDGSIETRLSLENGIFFNINAIPQKDNETNFFTVIGTFEFRTPDGFSYAIEFQADPKNFTLLNFERKETVQLAQLSVNPKILAALAGR